MYGALRVNHSGRRRTVRVDVGLHNVVCVTQQTCPVLCGTRMPPSSSPPAQSHFAVTNVVVEKRARREYRLTQMMAPAALRHAPVTRARLPCYASEGRMRSSLRLRAPRSVASGHYASPRCCACMDGESDA